MWFWFWSEGDEETFRKAISNDYNANPIICVHKCLFIAAVELWIAISNWQSLRSNMISMIYEWYYTVAVQWLTLLYNMFVILFVMLFYLCTQQEDIQQNKYESLPIFASFFSISCFPYLGHWCLDQKIMRSFRGEVDQWFPTFSITGPLFYE